MLCGFKQVESHVTSSFNFINETLENDYNEKKQIQRTDTLKSSKTGSSIAEDFD